MCPWSVREIPFENQIFNFSAQIALHATNVALNIVFHQNNLFNSIPKSLLDVLTFFLDSVRSLSRSHYIIVVN